MPNLTARDYARITKTHRSDREGYEDEPAPRQKRETMRCEPPRPVTGADQSPGPSGVVQEP
ncbi:hypothetical protein CRG98_039855 [Punica granatum]|uniref:Uncharacterized protein n=1 Tax=Punica granatum TaxID=22663 RepID=A0A2I0I836_PUNGR|nr:hypothetical protein CRG98_039855 [Punica granatum]